MDASLARRAAAEFVGTAMLVLFGPGSVVAALQVGEPLDFPGLGFVALSFGLVVALIIYALGTTSGCHINPAVTIALAAVGRFSWRDVGPYIAAQAVGAVVGALLIVAYAGDRATDLGSLGLTALGEGVSPVQGVVAEALGTFLLLFTIMAVAVDRRAPSGWAGFLIGLAVVVEILVIGPFTGGSVNPARSFGPYVVNDLFGGTTPWGDFWVYLVGPVIGAVAAAFAYEKLARPGAAEPPVGAPTQDEPPTARIPEARTPAEPGATASQSTAGRTP